MVHTPAGDVTVLKEQSTLGTLAKGQIHQHGRAGRVQRCRSVGPTDRSGAFYQMEQPYTSRYLLMTFSRTTGGQLDRSG